MDVEEDHILGDRTVILVEVKDTLKLFVKDNILGFDGWTVEFFSHFFDLLGCEISEAMEESCSNRNINELLNSIYLTLVPKKDHSNSFMDYRPISLCNLLYKMISRNIVERLKPFLGNLIS